MKAKSIKVVYGTEAASLEAELQMLLDAGWEFYGQPQQMGKGVCLFMVVPVLKLPKMWVPADRQAGTPGRWVDGKLPGA